MTDNLDALLDECIDRINRGQSLEECLASYPEHAERLEPLLRSILDIRATCSPMPSPAAKAAARQRFDAALAEGEKPLRLRGALMPSLTKPRAWAVAVILSLFAIIGGVLCLLVPAGAPAPVFAQPNFRLLISDDENAIGDFDHLNVTITSIRVHSASTGEWLNLTLPADPEERTIDLVPLQELNATEIWCGNLTEGWYTMVFLDVGNVTGVLNATEAHVDVMAPSGTLKINKSFAVTSGSQTTFVFDISVVCAGPSGQCSKYILKPVIGQSGPDQQFHLVGEGELTLQVVEGDVTRGGNITVLVTLYCTPVPGANVTMAVNDEDVMVATTNPGGLASFSVPEDAVKLVIKGTLDELEGELEIEL